MVERKASPAEPAPRGVKVPMLQNCAHLPQIPRMAVPGLLPAQGWWGRDMYCTYKGEASGREYPQGLSFG